MVANLVRALALGFVIAIGALALLQGEGSQAAFDASFSPAWGR